MVESSVIKTFNKEKLEQAAKNYLSGKAPSRVMDQPRIAIKQGLVKDEAEYLKYLNRFAHEVVRLQLKQSFTPEVPIIQVINAIDEVDQSINIQYERLGELFRMYYPEAKRLIKDPVHLAKVSERPNRSIISKELGLPEKSVGYDYNNDDLELIKELGQEIQNTINLRKKLEHYIKDKMKKVAPKLTRITGEMLGARLINLAGGLKSLAMMPSSTIQVLGAEKALFRHLRTGAKPPKHGIIIQHQEVQQAPRNERGRAARKLANKISIAVRRDYFEKE